MPLLSASCRKREQDAPATIHLVDRLTGGSPTRFLLVLVQVKCAVAEDVKSGGFYGPNLFNLYNDQERMYDLLSL